MKLIPRCNKLYTLRQKVVEINFFYQLKYNLVLKFKYIYLNYDVYLPLRIMFLFNANVNKIYIDNNINNSVTVIEDQYNQIA